MAEAMNKPFDFFEEVEGEVYKDLSDEVVSIYGFPCYYIPRTFINEDSLLGEDDISTFSTKYALKMFIKSVDAFEGTGDLYSKFGLIQADECTLEISKRAFKTATTYDKPAIGDIILIEWTYKRVVFEINYVELENPFYHLGQVPKFILKLKRWQYSHEDVTADNNLKDLIKNVEDNEDYLSDNDNLIDSGEDLIEI